MNKSLGWRMLIMSRYERTTRKPTMIKAINLAKDNSDDLLALCAKYFNELANGYYFAYMVFLSSFM